MDEHIRKALNLGLGAIFLTKEKVQAVVDELVEKGEVGKEESRELFDRLMEKGETAGKNLEKSVKNIMKEMELPTRKEFDELKSEIEQLKKKIDK